MEWARSAVAEAYAAAAETYITTFGDDLSAGSADRLLVDELLSGLGAGSLVMDGGCGPGQVAALALQAGHRCIGVDVTSAMLIQASRRLTGASLMNADLCYLPLSAASCDAVICWFSLHNLPRSLLSVVLAELQRVTRPTGRLLIATHGGSGEQQFSSPSGSPFVFTYYAAEDLAHAVQVAGFVDVEVRTRSPLPHELQVEKLLASASAPATQ